MAYEVAAFVAEETAWNPALSVFAGVHWRKKKGYGGAGGFWVVHSPLLEEGARAPWFPELPLAEECVKDLLRENGLPAHAHHRRGAPVAAAPNATLVHQAVAAALASPRRRAQRKPAPLRLPPVPTDACACAACHEGGELVLCDGPGCVVAVHAECLPPASVAALFSGGGGGGARGSAGGSQSWLCHRCSAEPGKGAHTPCVLCVARGGYVLPAARGGPFAHPVCAEHVRATFIEDDVARGVHEVRGVTEALGDWAALPKKTACGICRRRGGAFAQCSTRKCAAVMHVTCAIAAAHAAESGTGAGAPVADATFLVGRELASQRFVQYCPRHSAAHVHDVEVVAGVAFTSWVEGEAAEEGAEGAAAASEEEAGDAKRARVA